MFSMNRMRIAAVSARVALPLRVEHAVVLAVDQALCVGPLHCFHGPGRNLVRILEAIQLVGLGGVVALELA